MRIETKVALALATVVFTCVGLVLITEHHCRSADEQAETVECGKAVLVTVIPETLTSKAYSQVHTTEGDVIVRGYATFKVGGKVTTKGRWVTIEQLDGTNRKYLVERWWLH